MKIGDLLVVGDVEGGGGVLMIGYSILISIYSLFSTESSIKNRKLRT